MTQEYEALLALAAAHLLDPARTRRRLAATVRCYIKDVRPAFRYLAAHGISAALARPADLQQYSTAWPDAIASRPSVAKA